MVKYFPKSRLYLNHLIMNYLSNHDRNFPLSNDRINPFFIIGAGRSGTTLLRTILMGHPDIIIPPETFGFRPSFKDFHLLQNSNWETIVEKVISNYQQSKQFEMWEVDLFHAKETGLQLQNNQRSLANLIQLIFLEYGSKHKPSANIWGDKTPLNTYYLKYINMTFPQARYVNLVRDGRDVVSSLKVAGLSNSRNSCLRWNQAIELVNQFKNRVPSHRLLTIRYEDFVTQFESKFQNICSFLDLNYSDFDFKHESLSSKMKDVNQYKHFKNLLNPINDKSIGKWKSNLSDSEIKSIYPLIKTNLAQLGYE